MYSPDTWFLTIRVRLIFKSPNPEYGATITYFIKKIGPKNCQSDQAWRKKKALFEKGNPIPQRFLIADLDAEAKEIKPHI